MLEIPNFDLSGIINILKGLLNSLSTTIYSLASNIFPENPTLVVIIGCLITAYIIKDKIGGFAMFTVLAFMLYLIFSGGISL